MADTQIVAFGHALLTGFDALRRAFVVDERKGTDLDGRAVVQRGCIDDGTVDQVPLSEPKSSMRAWSPSRIMRAWLRETVMSLRKMPFAGSRPMVVTSSSSSKAAPVCGPLTMDRTGGGDAHVGHEVRNGDVA